MTKETERLRKDSGRSDYTSLQSEGSLHVADKKTPGILHRFALKYPG